MALAPPVGTLTVLAVASQRGYPDVCYRIHGANTLDAASVLGTPAPPATGYSTISRQVAFISCARERLETVSISIDEKLAKPMQGPYELPPKKLAVSS